MNRPQLGQLPMIPKTDLIDGAYYAGRCRNANIARWDAKGQRFRHWRTKWRSTFLEYIKHPEDEHVYDVFYPERRLDIVEREIPLEGGP